MLSKEYIAGFFDGEGSVSPRRRMNKAGKIARVLKNGTVKYSHGGDYSIGCSITQVDPRPLIQIKEQYGGILVYRARQEGNRRPVWLWQLGTRSAVMQFLQDIRPFLIVKADVADIALAALSMLKGRVGFRYSESVRDEISAMLSKINERNRKGRDAIST